MCCNSLSPCVILSETLWCAERFGKSTQRRTGSGVTGPALRPCPAWDRGDPLVTAFLVPGRKMTNMERTARSCAALEEGEAAGPPCVASSSSQRHAGQK